MGILVFSIPICIKYSDVISAWLMPTLIMMFVGYGFMKSVAVYESFTEGAKEGFQIAIKIIPYLVAMMVSIGMLRASGVLDALVNGLGRFTAFRSTRRSITPGSDKTALRLWSFWNINLNTFGSKHRARQLRRLFG
jgi:hypothetical protein